jgi:hypothetical protein
VTLKINYYYYYYYYDTKQDKKPSTVQVGLEGIGIDTNPEEVLDNVKTKNQGVEFSELRANARKEIHHRLSTDIRSPNSHSRQQLQSTACLYSIIVCVNIFFKRTKGGPKSSKFTPFYLFKTVSIEKSYHNSGTKILGSEPSWIKP